MDGNDDPDDEYEDEVAVPERLGAAAEALLVLAARARAGSESDRDRLVDLLALVGGFDHARREATGLFIDFEPEPVDEQERADLADRERAFVCWCADQLVELAAHAVEFAVALLASLHDDDPSPARAAAINEVREELLGELAIDAARPSRHRVQPTRRDVADFLGVAVLPFAAVDLAEAAHRLNDSRWPGQAAVTATTLAANLLTAADKIASAAGYLDWSDIDTGQ